MPLGAHYKSEAVGDNVEEQFRKRLAVEKKIYIQGRENRSYQEHFVKFASLPYVMSSFAKEGEVEA